ncbi:MAG: hypothetical protein ABI664_13315, partial [bacterium]
VEQREEAGWAAADDCDVLGLVHSGKDRGGKRFAPASRGGKRFAPMRPVSERERAAIGAGAQAARSTYIPPK